MTDVFYLGTSECWNEIYIDEANSALKNAEIHYMAGFVPILFTGIDKTASTYYAAVYDASGRVKGIFTPMIIDTTATVYLPDAVYSGMKSVKCFMFDDFSSPAAVPRIQIK